MTYTKRLRDFVRRAASLVAEEVLWGRSRHPMDALAAAALKKLRYAAHVGGPEDELVWRKAYPVAPASLTYGELRALLHHITECSADPDDIRAAHVAAVNELAAARKEFEVKELARRSELEALSDQLRCWQEATRDLVAIGTSVHPTPSPALVRAAARGLRDANQELRLRVESLEHELAEARHQ